jgi:hypothetical protein
VDGADARGTTPDVPSVPDPGADTFPDETAAAAIDPTTGAVIGRAETSAGPDTTPVPAVGTPTAPSTPTGTGSGSPAASSPAVATSSIATSSPTATGASTPSPASSRPSSVPAATPPAGAASGSTAEKAPASGGTASIRLDSDAGENFLVPTDPSTSISRHGKGAHAVSTKAGAYTVVARFAEGESPFFLDLNVSAGATCEVTCRASTHSCTASARCGTR